MYIKIMYVCTVYEYIYFLGLYFHESGSVTFVYFFQR
jgi:hypothetical protein